MPEKTPDLLVVGGGAVGLTIACDAAAAGLSVTLLDRKVCGREASWAGAGILPPRSWYVDHPALDWLAARADLQQETLSAELREATGIDDEYARCGSVYDLGDSPIRDKALGTLQRWIGLGEPVESLGDSRYLVPREAQVRNPRRLRALVALARQRGCIVVENCEAAELVRNGEAVTGVRTSDGELSAGTVCLAGGCWTPQLAASASVHVQGAPLRGQMLLLEADCRFDRILHNPPWYAVQRLDGLVLVGATVENVGFDNTTTDEGRQALTEAARLLDPRLAEARVLASWAGLRPGGADELPQIGWAPEVENLLIATAHNRSGLQLSPPTAEIIVKLLRGEETPLEARAFDPRRFGEPVAASA